MNIKDHLERWNGCRMRQSGRLFSIVQYNPILDTAFTKESELVGL